MDTKELVKTIIEENPIKTKEVFDTLMKQKIAQQFKNIKKN